MSSSVDTDGRTVLIGVGILAHNEAENIERTLRSLANQTLLRAPADAEGAIEIVCVPNGCTDDTPRIAREILTELFGPDGSVHVRWRVDVVDEPGKANAWNRCVHEFAAESCEYLIFMDADIDLNVDTAFASLVDALRADANAHAVVGRPIKSIASAESRGPIARLSLATSTVSAHGPVELNGGLYCARPIIRRIWLPKGLLVDDGYIKAMLVTDFFTHDDDRNRLIRANDAQYEFDAYTSPRDVFRHQTRLVAGIVVNSLVYTELWAIGAQSDAGELARVREAEDPDWVDNLVREHVRTSGRWVLPKGFERHYLFKRARKLRHMRPLKALLYVPVVVVGIAFELPVLIAANRQLRRGALRW